MIDVRDLFVEELGELLTDIVQFNGMLHGEGCYKGWKSVLYVKFFCLCRRTMQCQTMWRGMTKNAKDSKHVPLDYTLCQFSSR